MSFKEVAVFLACLSVAFSFSTSTPGNPEISYIDSEALGTLQEILASEFEGIHKRIDELQTLMKSTPPTIPQTETETETEEPEEVTTNQIQPENNLEKGADFDFFGLSYYSR